MHTHGNMYEDGNAHELVCIRGGRVCVLRGSFTFLLRVAAPAPVFVIFDPAGEIVAARQAGLLAAA